MKNQNKLNIDRQTFTELEIFRDDTMGMNIFNLLDRTTTDGGRDSLKQHFLNPYNTTDQILSLQDVLKTILQDIDKFEIPFSKKMMDMVEVYYFSKSEVLVSQNSVGRFLEGLIYRMKYKDYKETAINGTKNTLAFIIQMQKYFSRFEYEKLPTILKEYYNTVQSTVKENEISEACKIKNIKTLDFLNLITLDQIFRQTHKMKIVLLIEIAYKLDSLISMATAIKDYNLTFPEVIESETPIFQAEGLYHLFLKTPIPNDLKFEPNKNFLFLTGPNMAGKTTFLKSCGIAIYLAQLGMGVPAKKLQIAPFNALFSSLNTTDNLSIGYSYFYSEVIRVRKAAETLQSDKKVFMIFDELFKGTNIKDAYDGSMLVINGLLKWNKCMFILSSHLTELSKEINTKPSVFFKYFDSSIDNGKPIFSYKIYDGKSNERLGLVILQNENIENLLNP